MNNHNTVIEVKVLTPEQESVKNLAIAKMARLEALKRERRNMKDKLKFVMEQDGEYKKVFESTDESKKKLKVVKARLDEKPEIFNLKESIKELNREYNEVKQDVSDYLVMFEKMTGQLSFINPEGKQVEIHRSATPVIVKVKKK